MRRIEPINALVSTSTILPSRSTVLVQIRTNLRNVISTIARQTLFTQGPGTDLRLDQQDDGLVDCLVGYKGQP